MLHSYHFFFHLQACFSRPSTCGWHVAFTSLFNHVNSGFLFCFCLSHSPGGPGRDGRVSS